MKFTSILEVLPAKNSKFALESIQLPLIRLQCAPFSPVSVSNVPGSVSIDGAIVARSNSCGIRAPKLF